MARPLIAALPAVVRPFLETPLPADLHARGFATADEALAIGPGAEIGGFDMHDKSHMAAEIIAATDRKWLNSIDAGIDAMPLAALAALAALAEHGVMLTHSAGINAITIAKHVLLGYGAPSASWSKRTWRLSTWP